MTWTEVEIERSFFTTTSHRNIEFIVPICGTVEASMRGMDFIEILMSLFVLISVQSVCLDDVCLSVCLLSVDMHAWLDLIHPSEKSIP